MDKTGFGVLLLILLVVGFFGNGIYTNVMASYAFDREIGDLFDAADRASTAAMKADYFDKFVAALERVGLTEGQSTIFFPRPHSDLAWAYQIAKSLQTRLHEIAEMDPKSFEYQMALQQVTYQEFCWFPLGTFYGGYALMRGAWGDALFPAEDKDRCAPPKS